MLLIVALFAAGCGKGKDRDGDGVADDVDCAPDDAAYAEEVTWQRDGDGDGYGMAAISCEPPDGVVELGGDCADGDPGRHPEADEHCDGVDEDCDGTADDNAVDTIRWSKDNDGDGYGSVSGVITACDGPLGFISRGGDCDDRDFEVHPGVPETCDDEDQDCDGEIDEEPVDAPRWYPDADEDGYGSNTDAVNACKQPAGYLPTKGDCDDADDLLNPGEVEYCNGFDDDCDGLLDKDDPDEAGDGTWFFDADGDGFGIAEGTTTSCSWPAGYARRDGDCDDAVPAVNPGAAEVCMNGLDDDCDGAAPGCGEDGESGLSSGAWATWASVEAGAVLGFNRGMAAIGDWDGDGADELIIGAQGSGSGAGAVYLLPGGGSGTVTSGVTLRGGAAGDVAGFAVAGPGDIDGDGFADVVIGAPGASSLTGAAYLVLGPVTKASTVGAAASATLIGPAASQTGYAVAGAGDQDGDGLPDVLVAANSLDAGAGRVYLVSGSATGSVALGSDALASVSGAAGEGLGWSVTAGDLSGDGIPDPVLGGPFDGSSGQAWVFEGPLTHDLDSVDGVAVAAEQAGSAASFSMDASGDYDGDGYDDLAVGAYGWDDASADSGRVYVVFGPIAADMALVTADATFDGESGAFCGYAVSAAGSPNGDDLTDLAIGCALGWAPATQRGVAALIYGGFGVGNYAISDHGLRYVGVADFDVVGGGLSAAGDQDGDGIDDWLVAAPYNSDAAAGAGKVVVLLGASGF